MRFTLIGSIAALTTFGVASPFAYPTLATDVSIQAREELGRGGGGGAKGGKGGKGTKNGIPDVGPTGKDCKACQDCTGAAFGGTIGVVGHGNPNLGYLELGAQTACETITCKDCH